MTLPIEEEKMTLPVIDVPTYEMKVPSTGQKLTVRPFTVKEEKLLMMAVEANNMNDVAGTVKQIINNCIVKGKVDVDKLPFFDIDYMFIFLRAKSIGETQEINLTCKNEVDGVVCNNVFPAKLDIANVEVVKDDSISNEIKLDSKNGVKMKYPAYSVIKSIEAAKSDLDKKIMMIVNSIEYIYTDKGTFSAKDHSKKELQQFVESLTEANYKKLEQWVDNFPTFVARIQAKCTKCGFEHDVRYSDFMDFFY